MEHERESTDTAEEENKVEEIAMNKQQQLLGALACDGYIILQTRLLYQNINVICEKLEMVSEE